MFSQRFARYAAYCACCAVTVAWHTPLRAAVAAGLSAPAAPYKAPYLPAADTEQLQEVPSTHDPAVVQMRTLRAAFAAADHDLPAAIKLANAYIEYSRQIGDAHYAGYAEAVIAPWLATPTPPAVVQLTQATILQYRHQFADARSLLQRTLALEPHNGQAWLTLATLDMVQGDYVKASKGCAQVINNAGLELGTACIGNLRSYTGQARQSLVLLQQASAGAGTPVAGNSVAGTPVAGTPVGVTPATAAYQAWVHGLIAETAERLGEWQLAEQHYRAALELLPRDNFLLVAYADFLLDRGRPREVLPLLADHAQSDTAFLRIALAQAALHSAETARYTWIMAARFEALTLRGSDYFGREEARFALQLQHDPATSLDMAKRNWQLQKAPWDARVLLEAAVAAHQPQAAADVVDFIRTTKLEDAMLTPLLSQVTAASAVVKSP